MLSLKQKFLIWLQEPRNRSRFIAGTVGVFVLVGVVLFSNQIGNLLSLFGSKAGISEGDLSKLWEQVELTGGEKRAHAKLITVQKDGKAWLYVAGGIDVQRNLIAERYQTIMVNSVQRIELDPQTGLVKSGVTTWENVPSTNFGHAEFGFVESGDYLYVVSGDLHTPPEAEGKVPLLYSTVERLRWNDPEARWEVFALLSGVNFYPEVKVSTSNNNRIHVVGGIYGNPFSPFPNMVAEDQAKDMLDEGSSLWDELDLIHKPVLGNVGISLPYGVLYSSVEHGATPTPTPVDPGPVVTPPDDVITVPTTPTTTGLKTVMNRTVAFIKSVSALVGKYKTTVPQAMAASGDPKIIGPGNGGKLQAGDYYNIQWEGQIPTFVPLGRLYFRENSTAKWKIAGGPINLSSNNHRYIWKVGYISGPAGTPYYGPSVSSAEVKVCAMIAPPSLGQAEQIDCNYFEMGMDGTFSIDQEFWVTINGPVEGSLLEDNNRPVNIVWDYHGTNATVKLEYLTENEWHPISTVSAAERSYKWLTPNFTGDHNIRIRATIIPPEWRSVEYLPGTSGVSEKDYLVHDRGDDWVEITNPSGGEVWEPGSTHVIYWNAKTGYGQKVYIYYTLNDTDNLAYIGQTNGDSLSWQIPNNIFSEHARITIKTYALQGDGTYKEVTATSNIFSIKSSVELSPLLSKGLIDGSFVTTVSEHIVIHADNANASESGELGSDYDGTFSENWEVNKVSHLGHLRFVVAEEILSYTGGSDPKPVKTYKVVPVPQGRYGHKLLSVGNTLYVFGGASWAKEITIGNKPSSAAVLTYRSFKSFWVIEDVVHPFYEIPANPNHPFNFGKINYTFKGNIAYRLVSGTNWTGSNIDRGLDIFTFKNALDAKEGRAFFGMASPNPSDPITVGGLIDQTGSEGRYDLYTYSGTQYYRIPVTATEQVERMDSGGWQQEQSYSYLELGSDIPINIPIYDIQAFGLDGGVVVYGGQKEFQYDIPTGYQMYTPDFIGHDPHVPDMTFNDFSSHTAMYIPASDSFTNRWKTMAEIEAGDADYFSAQNLSVTGATETPLKAVYRFGGIDAGDKIFADNLRVLGAYGKRGMPDVNRSSLTVVPATVAADGVSYAIATVTLKDSYGDTVVGMYTTVTTDDSTGKVTVTPFEGDQDVPPDPRFPGYLKTRVDGTVTFKLISSPVESPLPVNVFASWTDQPNSSLGNIGPAQVTFTNEGVPIPSQSIVTVDKPKVIAHKTLDKATVTVTLNGTWGNQLHPVAGYYVKVTSSRNDGTTIVDSITALNGGVTNSEGKATFEVRSDTIGQVTITGYYGKDTDQLTNNPIQIPTTANFEFWLEGPRLTTISPNSSFRNKSLVLVEITGADTHFVQGTSVVSFTPPASNGTGIEIISTTVHSATQKISLIINVKDNATLGGWNVTVTTGSEVANKDGNDDFIVVDAIDTTLSTISAVPRFVPADGSAYSVVTVTLRSKGFIPLSGWEVSIASDRLGDVITTYSNENQEFTLTDEKGRARFKVRANVIGTSNITGTVSLSNTKLGPTKIEFEDPNSLVSATLDITVPLQANAYDRQIKLYVREKTTGIAPVVDEVYFTDNADKILDLPTIYLHPGKAYGAWAKGRYHLARVKEFTAGTTNGTISINFTDMIANPLGGGLLVGDFWGAPDKWLSVFQDNKINIGDFWLPIGNWGPGHAGLIADINQDTWINNFDLGFLIRNFGSGAPLP